MDKKREKGTLIDQAPRLILTGNVTEADLLEFEKALIAGKVIALPDGVEVTHAKPHFNCFQCDEITFDAGLKLKSNSVSALVSAAMHKADISNLRTLATAFPIIWLQTYIAFNKGWSREMFTEENVLEAVDELTRMEIGFPLEHLLKTGQLSYNEEPKKEA